MLIVTVRYKTNDECWEALKKIPAFFCPTTTQFSKGDEIVIEIVAPALPNKVMARAEVIDWRAALPRNRVRAGANVVFSRRDQAKIAFVVAMVSGEKQDAVKRKHNRLPIEVPTRYRTSGQLEWTECSLVELSEGGGLLKTDKPLELGQSVSLEITFPRAGAPTALTAKTTYHAGASTGVQFDTRDQMGSRRLKEMVRRVRDGE